MGLPLAANVGIRARVLKGNRSASAFLSDFLGLVVWILKDHNKNSKVFPYVSNSLWTPAVCYIRKLADFQDSGVTENSGGGSDFSASAVNFEDKRLHNAYS